MVCALLHDIGNTLGSANHADVAASILEPFLSEENLRMIKHNAVVQGSNFFHYLAIDRNMRDQFQDHLYYQHTLRFVDHYDDLVFDDGKPTLSLDLFEPMVRNVFAKPLNSLYEAALNSE